MKKNTWMVFFGMLIFVAQVDATGIKHRRHNSKAHSVHSESTENEEDYDPSHFEYTWTFLAPMEGRKVALNGMPMAGSPPETNADSDYYREETSLDACSMDVQHSVTDIHIPVGSDHMALEVRRTLTQEIWGQDGLEPDLRPDKPFGKGWGSNIAPSIYWSRGWFGDGHLYVTDHTGQQYNFYMANASSIPYPVAHSGQSAMDMLRTRLVRNGNGTYTLSLPNGTVLNYSGFFITKQTQRDTSSGTIYRYHEFARLWNVEDRHGNRLDYSGGIGTCIPTSITASPSGLSLTISQSNGRVDSITDPNGNTVQYNYDGSFESMDDDDLGATIRSDDENWDASYSYEYGYWPSGKTVLSEVERENGATTEYRYWFLTEEDYRFFHEDDDGAMYPNGMFYINGNSWKDAEDQHHLCIRSITDANDNAHSFRFQNRFQRQASSFYDSDWSGNGEYGRVPVYRLGVPRLLTSVELPDGEDVTLSRTKDFTTLYKSNGAIPNGYVGYQHNLQTCVSDSVKTRIYDAQNTAWTYEYEIEPYGTFTSLRQYYDYWPSPGNRDTRVYFPDRLTVSNNHGYGETFEFASQGKVDINIPGFTADGDPHVISLTESSDQWGNATRYEYAAMPGISSFVSTTSHSKPTKQYDAYNEDTRYWYYNTAARAYQPDWEYDKLDRKTDYAYLTTSGKYGLRSEIKIQEGSATRQRTTFEYTDTTWPSFMTKKTEHDVGSSDPSFVQREITYAPHAQGLVEQEVIDPTDLAITTTYGYDSNNNQIVVIDPNLNTNWYGYDSLNRLVAITNADFTTRSIGYDLRGNKIAETNENGNVTFWQYDEFNRVTNEIVDLNKNGLIEAADISTKTTYNTMGSVSSVTDPNGTVTTNLYDHLQRVTNSIVDPGGLNYVTTYEYGANSGSLLFEPYEYKPTLIVDARGYETVITYDKLYREVEQLEQVNATEYAKTTRQYDDVGNLRFETRWKNGSANQLTTTTYDALNQPDTTTYEDGASIVYDYTSSGLLYRQRDERLNWTTTHYDKAQRPWKVVQPSVTGGAPEIITQYDAVGNITNAIDARSISTQYRFDKRYRKTHDISPLVWDEENQMSDQSVVVTYYDDVGNVKGILDARQNLTTNFYDAANRLTNSILPEVAVYGGGTTQPYTKTTHDKNGNPRFVEDGNGNVVEMQYDVLNRIKKSINGELHEIAYGYDSSGNREWIKDQNGNVTTFEYDGLNRNTRIAYANSSEESYGYDWLGNKTSRTDAANQITEYVYDERNRLDLVKYMSNSVPYRTRDYEYDNAENLETVVESDNTLANVTYTYDALNRIVTEISCGVTHTYIYDLAGNRTDATYGITGRHVEWDYDPLNRIESIEDTQGYTSTINVFGGGGALQTAINGASGGERILVADGTYTPVLINKPVTVESVNGEAYATIQAASGRCAELSNNARLVGFTITGGNLVDGKGAGALIGKGCLIADCDIDGNTVSGINAYGGGLFLETGATAQNCLIQNNSALNGGGIFCEKGGLIRNCTIEDNEAESMGGGGVFMQEGGWMAGSIIDGNIATNTFARGGGGVLFYNDGGKVNSSTLSANTSSNNGAAYSHISTYVHPEKVGAVKHSTFWNNTPTSSSNGWISEGNQTVDPSGTPSAPGANLFSSSYASSGTRVTAFKYDLNSNLMKRELPNDVDEYRTYNALNRIVANTNKLLTTAFSTHEYQYDAVGNLRQMDDTVSGLHTIPSSATWNWAYDNAYRLNSETVVAATEPTRKTEFDWDDAGNRTAIRKYSGGSLASTTYYKAASQLNQMLGWTSGETNAVYTYDPKGNRDNKFIIVAGETDTTNYEYDEDNRLIQVTLRDTEQPKVYSFGYDYRTRRITRETPTEKTTHVFDGSLSVQEFDTSESATLSVNNLTTESIRGEGMGGGVGGMVYSVRNGQLEASHSNHRGDVTIRTDNMGNINWFARYNAYGTRFNEVGATYDRQRGNTKDEEENLYLLNQGMRWDDIVHGVWLSKDPAGFGDGPNLYLYVHCNPINNFDPLGLETVRAKFERNNVMPLYHAWNALSLGVLKRNDARVEKYESGEISRTEMTVGAVADGGVNIALTLVGGQIVQKGGAAIMSQQGAITTMQQSMPTAIKLGTPLVTALGGTKITAPVAPVAPLSQSSVTKPDYSNIPDPKNVGQGKPFTRSTKRKILEQNKATNNGVIRSDKSGVDAVPSKQSKKGVTPPENEAQIDHIVPKSKGGSNSPRNAQVLTRKENREKSDK